MQGLLFNCFRTLFAPQTKPVYTTRGRRTRSIKILTFKKFMLDLPISMNKLKILLLITLLALIFCPGLSAQEHSLAGEYLYKLGQTYFQQNRYADAEIELKKCLTLNPQHKGALELLQRIEGGPVKPAKGELREKAMLLALEETEKKMEETEKKIPLSKKQEVIKKTIPEEKTEVLAEEVSDKEFPFIGGAWGVPKGHYQLELYTKYYYHDSQFDSDGNKTRWGYGGKGSEIYTEFKIDYGFSDNVTLWAHIPFKEAYWKDDYAKRKTEGFADIWLGGKYRFLDNPMVLSLQLLGKFPAGYNENASPSLGKDQLDYEITLLSAKTFGPLYLKADSGYRWRNEEPADTVPYFLELGYQAFDRILFKTSLDGVESLSRTGQVEDYTKWTLSTLFTLKRGLNPHLSTKDKLEFELGYGETFTGRNSSAASEIFTKILYYF